MPENRNQ
nr:unnamed protein product [Callosobruchus chinensis]